MRTGAGHDLPPLTLSSTSGQVPLVHDNYKHFRRASSRSLDLSAGVSIRERTGHDPGDGILGSFRGSNFEFGSPLLPGPVFEMAIPCVFIRVGPT